MTPHVRKGKSHMPQPDKTPSRRPALGLGGFAQRVLVVVLIVALAYALWRLADVALLLFAAVLMAIGLRSGARFVSKRTRLGVLVSLGVVVILLLVALAAALWFFGAMAAGQVDELVQQVPAGFRMLVGRIQQYPLGRYVLEQVRGAGVAGATGWATSLLAAIAQGLALGAGYAVVTVISAIYLAAEPDRYRRMCFKVLPLDYRTSVTALFDRTADILRRWMAGQFVVMVVIGTLSGFGLWALGIEAPFALGLVGGLLCFIPYVGAILAAVPATLVALTQGPTQAGMVILMYVAVHFVEGNFITPLVQAEATELPPVLALLSTVGFSLLFGPSAVLLAAPLTLFLMVAIDVLWVEQALEGEDQKPSHG
jgi:predicted PurR-regulated permease PerM